MLSSVEEVYPDAIDAASLEVEEGRYDEIELAERVNKEAVFDKALELTIPEL
jgi:hypothetical protein